MVTSMKRAQTVVLKIGETHVTRESITFKCYGLGSCIGLFLYDAHTSNAAGAHIMLPGAHDEELHAPTAFSSNAVELMINELERLGSIRANLRAKIAGGGNVANINTITIGQDNIDAVRHDLVKRSIPIMSMNVGGTLVRSVQFYSATKELFVTAIDAKNIFPQNLISTTYV
jgi:chemotaxis protein CheD